MIGIVCLIKTILMIFLLPHCWSKKILMLPLQFPSLVSLHQTLGNALIERGHEVTMVLPPSIPKFDKLSQGKIKVLSHEITGYDFYKEAENAEEDMIEIMLGKYFTFVYRYLSEGVAQYCKDAINDKNLMATLQNEKFDLAVVDSNSATRQYYLIPYLLDIPYISLNCERDSWALRNTDFPSHVPFVLGTQYTNQMDFWQRLDNTYKMVDWALFPPWYNENDFFKSLVPDSSVSLEDLYRKSLLFFIDCDMIIDYPRATLPNEIILGGLTLRKPKPLPADLEKIVAQAQDGVIVMSFGSSFPDRNTGVFMDVFRRLPHTIIWRFFGKTPESVPDNVKLMPWLPQQDLLAHEKTKLFITHCGSFGQHESVFHGVPMVGFPFSMDQMYNARRMEKHGFGIALDITTFTQYDLFAAIKEILDNPSFKNKTEKASRIMQDRPLWPLEEATNWVEHVMKFGGDHLRPHVQDMPPYQILMIDVLAFITCCATAMLFLFIFAVKYVIKRFHYKPKQYILIKTKQK